MCKLDEILAIPRNNLRTFSTMCKLDELFAIPCNNLPTFSTMCKFDESFVHLEIFEIKSTNIMIVLY